VIGGARFIHESCSAIQTKESESLLPSGEGAGLRHPAQPGPIAAKFRVNAGINMVWRDFHSLSFPSPPFVKTVWQQASGM
jgi:hypothetical protein